MIDINLELMIGNPLLYDQITLEALKLCLAEAAEFLYVLVESDAVKASTKFVCSNDG